MLSGGPSGFYNAPVMKSITLLVAGSSIGVSVFGMKKMVGLGNPSTLLHGLQLWRLIPNYVFFSNPLEAVLGVLFLYHFRVFERQMGSAKFAAFVMSTWVMNSMMTLLFVVLFPSRNIVSGPYGLVFSLLVQFYFEVPSTYRFRIFGISVGDKILTYLLSLQLMGTQFPSSLFAALSGIVVGLIYRSEILPIQRFIVPSSLVRLAQRYILPLVQQPRRRAPLNLNMLNPQQRAPIQQHMPTAAVPPPESAVAVLMDMGFSREEARAALSQANNDPQLAAALLLDQH